jgi:hypothetical protein
MWQLPAEVLSLLQAPSNGVKGRPRLLPRRTQPDWHAYRDELESYRHLTDDYDGQGAIAPPGEVIDTALSVAREFASSNIVPPTCTVAGPNGSIDLSWEFNNGVSVSIEATECDRVDVILMEPGNPRHWNVQQSVTA